MVWGLGFGVWGLGFGFGGWGVGVGVHASIRIGKVLCVDGTWTGQDFQGRLEFHVETLIIYKLGFN